MAEEHWQAIGGLWWQCCLIPNLESGSNRSVMSKTKDDSFKYKII